MFFAYFTFPTRKNKDVDKRKTCRKVITKKVGTVKFELFVFGIIDLWPLLRNSVFICNNISHGKTFRLNI